MPKTVAPLDNIAVVANLLSNGTLFSLKVLLVYTKPVSLSFKSQQTWLARLVVGLQMPLRQPILYAVWARLYELPIVIWTGMATLTPKKCKMVSSVLFLRQAL